jgi:hypothetical protein
MPGEASAQGRRLGRNEKGRSVIARGQSCTLHIIFLGNYYN